MDTSDGEIKDDLSDISEDDYFGNLQRQIEKRKLELELLNTIESYDEYSKENRFENRRHTAASTSRGSVNSKKEKSRKNEIRNRSYRASSIFSSRSTYSLPKKKRERQKSYVKKKRYSKTSHSPLTVSSEDDSLIEVIEKKSGRRSESDEEELLSLRLQALTSKQEVKELIEPDTNSSKPATPAPSEEEQLRIAALRSAVFKKREHFKELKKLKMLENERPYSPTDSFEPIQFLADDPMELDNSPLGSPFHSGMNDINQEVDMEISNSPPPPLNEDVRESIDMEIVLSPQKVTEEENEEEIALRSMLLSSLNKRKDDAEDPMIALNLKMAVERIKQQKLQPTISVQKSGTKTIKMILEEQKYKRLKETAQSLAKKAASVKIVEELDENIPINNEEHLSTSLIFESTQENIGGKLQEETSTVESHESDLIHKITNDELIININVTSDKIDEHLPAIDNDSSFSTITDTKNIPLLPQHEHEATVKKDSRLITSLDLVIRPVTPLIISVTAESSDDEFGKDFNSVNKTVRKTIRETNAKDNNSSNDFEKYLDKFLKNIRTQQEQSVTSSKPNTIIQNQTNTASNKKLSAVKHLPLSSQKEYEQLLLKMKELQEAKKQRHKDRILKRTKSQSSTTSGKESSNIKEKISVQAESESSTQEVLKIKPQLLVEVPKKSSDILQNKTSKIDETLSKIPLLDEAARQRLIVKTENNFLNHSKNLMESTESNIKLLNENNLEIRRREKVESKIIEFEKLLLKYKSYLKVINGRIKSNIPKVLQSQRDMIKLRHHQFKFGQICERVGNVVCGESYRLPDHQSNEIMNNFVKISEKTEHMHCNSNEQYASKQLKLLSDKVKNFTSVNSERKPNKCDNDSKPAETLTNLPELSSDFTSSTIPKKDNVADTKNENHIEPESSVSKLIAECENNNDCFPLEKNDDEVLVPLRVPEIQKHLKRILDDAGAQSSKKVKLYESPLEFLKMSSVNNSNKSLNKVVCPFALEGSCDDENCNMLHI